ncbi:hypothetical protein HPB50_021393 [Hyalomma asiaticum]|uniref:Uncharacterized protein n=1 Tax=Hyalomma asiaticum TaxID=266040 RepID=A0ACB7RKT1_HYAAI|nr:hypothetical protein HPB50_021393 [Hyalomma asiaticum]
MYDRRKHHQRWCARPGIHEREKLGDAVKVLFVVRNCDVDTWIPTTTRAGGNPTDLTSRIMPDKVKRDTSAPDASRIVDQLTAVLERQATPDEFSLAACRA